MSEKTAGFSQVNHVGITVSNLEKSIVFYEALTGKKISNIDEIGGKRMAEREWRKPKDLKILVLNMPTYT